MMMILIITSTQNVIAHKLYSSQVNISAKNTLIIRMYTHEHIHTCITTVLLYGSDRIIRIFYAVFPW